MFVCVCVALKKSAKIKTRERERKEYRERKEEEATYRATKREDKPLKIHIRLHTLILYIWTIFDKYFVSSCLNRSVYALEANALGVAEVRSINKPWPANVTM